MQKYIAILFFFFFLFPPMVFAQNADFKPYYFPFKKLKKAKIYQFTAKNQPELTQYWKMQYFERDGEEYLMTEAYNAKFQLFEYFLERMDNSGSQLQTLLRLNHKNRMDTVQIIDKDVFKWQQGKTETIRWSMLTNNEKNETLFLAKQRETLQDCQTTPHYKGKSLPTICFKDALHSVNSDTYEELFAFTQTSYYAQKLGLIGFDRFFEYAEEQNVNYRLTKIWKEKKWNKLLNEY